jgi:hypothetical protein
VGAAGPPGSKIGGLGPHPPSLLGSLSLILPATSCRVIPKGAVPPGPYSQPESQWHGTLGLARDLVKYYEL